MFYSKNRQELKKLKRLMKRATTLGERLRANKQDLLEILEMCEESIKITEVQSKRIDDLEDEIERFKVRGGYDKKN